MRTKVSVLISLIVFASLLLSACAAGCPGPRRAADDRAAQPQPQPKRPAAPAPRRQPRRTR